MGANYKFYIPQPNKDTDKMVEELYGAYISNTRKMDWLFSNLDSRNVIEAASVKADWVYAGTVLAENIDVTNATITTAQIDTLTVGSNVEQGTAPIVFTVEPTTPYRVGDIWTDGTDLKKCKTARATGAYVAADWELGTNYTNPTGVTSIVGGVVTTDYVNALSVVAGSVSAENITGTYITGKTIRTAAAGSTRLELSTGNTLSAYSSSTLIGSLSLWSTGIYLNTNSSSNTVSITAGAGYSGVTGGGVIMTAGSASFRVSTAYNEAVVSAGNFKWGGATVATQTWVTGQTYATQTWVNTNANTDANTGSDTTGSHNHGIANGTKLAIDGGGSVTWAVFAGDAHTHSMS